MARDVVRFLVLDYALSDPEKVCGELENAPFFPVRTKRADTLSHACALWPMSAFDMVLLGWEEKISAVLADLRAVTGTTSLAFRDELPVLLLVPLTKAEGALRALRMGASGIMWDGPPGIGVQVAHILGRTCIAQGAREQAKAGLRKFHVVKKSCGHSALAHGLDVTDTHSLSGNSPSCREELLTRVSHELRTPLTAVHGTIEILSGQLRSELSPLLRECFDIALRNVRQLQGMINDLVDTARVCQDQLALDRTRIETGELLEDVVRVAGSSAVQEVTQRAAGVVLAGGPEGTPPVFGDEKRLRQILESLISVASRHSVPGSDVRLSALPECSDDQRAVPQIPGSVLFTVSFSSVDGRDLQEIAEGLFEPFAPVGESMKNVGRQGLGLDLFLARMLVEMHGGEIRAQGLEGSPNAFVFSIPVFL